MSEDKKAEIKMRLLEIAAPFSGSATALKQLYAELLSLLNLNE